VTIGQRDHVDEFGEIHTTEGKIRIVQMEHVHRLHAIIIHEHNKHADGGIPRISIEGWWRDLVEEGLLPKFSEEYYIACRNKLEELRWIEVSEYWSRHKHLAKTCKLFGDRGPLVGTVYTYPSSSTTEQHTLLRVMTQSASRKWGLPSERPPPKGQSPPTRGDPGEINVPTTENHMQKSA
jgi:hypothetical protein